MSLKARKVSLIRKVSSHERSMAFERQALTIIPGILKPLSIPIFLDLVRLQRSHRPADQSVMIPTGTGSVPVRASGLSSKEAASAKSF